MDITLPIQIKVHLPEGKKFSVGNVAAAVRELALNQKVTEAIIQRADHELVEKYCGEKHSRGNGKHQYQRAGSIERHPVTAVGRLTLTLHRIKDTVAGRIFVPVEERIEFQGKRIYQGAPRKTMLSSLVKVRPEERLATTSELNPASSLVTGCGEARGMGYWAATQVKGLSPCSEAICWSCGCKSHHCNSQFGSVVISDSRCGDSSAESSEVKAFFREASNQKGRSERAVRVRRSDRPVSLPSGRVPQSERGIRVWREAGVRVLRGTVRGVPFQIGLRRTGEAEGDHQ